MKKWAKNPATADGGSTDRPADRARRLLLGGCPRFDFQLFVFSFNWIIYRQFEPMLDLIANIKYYDAPPYDKLQEYIDDAIDKTGARVCLF
jgi:hypothetical protein